MQSLNPREVERGAPWRWARESLGLIGRRPGAFLAASLVLLAVFLGILRVDQPLLRGACALVLPPLALTSFIRLAEAADHGRYIPPAGYFPTTRELRVGLGLVSVAYALVFALALAVGGGVEGLVELAAAFRQSDWPARLRALLSGLQLPFSWTVAGLSFGASLFVFCALILFLCAWFVLPLVQLGRLPTLHALRLSLAAYRLNTAVLGVTAFTVLAVAALLHLLAFGLLTPLAAPFLGAMLYVSYREVFLGRAENAPARARSRAFTALGAGARSAAAQLLQARRMQ